MANKVNTTYLSLDFKNSEELELYEKALYRAFSSSYIKTLDYIWNINHKLKKINTKVSYEYQEIIIAKVANRIVAGTSINFSLTETLQLELMNFTINKTQKDFCEVLYIFSLLDFVNGKPVILSLSKLLMENLKKRNITRIYSTCSLKRLNGYQIIGFTVIDQQVFEGETKFLLEMKVTDKIGIINE